MTKNVNNHINDSEELFRRLESGDPEGLDDFEKEALEGFASLENPGLARKLNAQVENKLSGTYFKKKKSNAWVWSLAAGLVLVVGLSIVFYNYMGSHKELELAVTTPPKSFEPAYQEPASDMNSAPETAAAEITAPHTANKPADEKVAVTGHTENTGTFEKEKDGDIRSRAIPVPEAEKKEQVADKLSVRDNEGFASADHNASPPVNASPALEEQNAKPAQNYGTSPSFPNGNAAMKSGGEVQSQTTAAGGLAKTENAKEADVKTKEVAAKNDEAPGKKNKAAEAPSATQNLRQENEMVATGTTKDNNDAKGGTSADLADNGDYKKPGFADKKFTTAQEYIKSEIDKDAVLKGNVNSFKAKLSIDKDGKVSKVQFIAGDFKNCSNCENNLEKILKDMPSWQAAEKSGKKVTETIDFVYP